LPIASGPTNRITSGGIVSSASPASSGQPLDVHGLARLDEAPHQRRLGAVVGGTVHACERPLTLLALEPFARALERAVRSGDAEAQDVGSLAGRPTEDVTKDEGAALPGG